MFATYSAFDRGQLLGSLFGCNTPRLGLAYVYGCVVDVGSVVLVCALAAGSAGAVFCGRSVVGHRGDGVGW